MILTQKWLHLQYDLSLNLRYFDKFFKDNVNDKFIPLKAITKWSRTISATYIIFVDIRSYNV